MTGVQTCALPISVLSGEEQGLLGGTRLAERAKQNNWEIEGVLNNDTERKSTEESSSA